MRDGGPAFTLKMEKVERRISAISKHDATRKNYLAGSGIRGDNLGVCVCVCVCVCVGER